jgi:signal peptidase I
VIVTWIILIASGILLVNLALNALLLWLTCKLCRVGRDQSAKPNYGRALAASLALAVYNVLLVLASAYGIARLDSEFQHLATLISIGAGLVAVPVIVGLVIRPSVGKTLLVSLIWFVLSSIFGVGEYFAIKSSVAEPFIIPTGANAENLYGYHREVTCPKCGVKFPVNASGEVEHIPPIVTIGCVCPNCRYELGPRDMSSERVDGDRFLASKWLTDGLLGPRRRFDFVIFYYPETAEHSQSPLADIKRFVGLRAEKEDQYREQPKYTKRLVGLPGETIGIHYGKLYVLDKTAGLKYEDRPKDSDDLRKPDSMHIDDPQALDWLTNRQKFTIFRKSPEQILALKHLVYDHDHSAADARWPRWEPEENKSWEESPPHGFKFAGKGQAQTAWLRYRHRLRDDDGKPGLITDFCGYNSAITGGDRGFGPVGHRHPEMNWVGDLIIDCVVIIEKAEGTFVLELSKGVDRFQASWDLSNGEATLQRINEEKVEKLDSKPTTLKGGCHHLRFANVDDRLIVWVDEALPFGDGVAYEAARVPGPTKENDLQPAGIGMRGSGVVAVQNLQLWRDTYYSVVPGRADAEVRDWTDPNDWRPLHNLPARTFYVQPGHYFCLGDNSMESSDSRSWGLVPERLMIGRALLVYYPFSRWGAIK